MSTDGAARPASRFEDEEAPMVTESGKNREAALSYLASGTASLDDVARFLWDHRDYYRCVPRPIRIEFVDGADHRINGLYDEPEVEGTIQGVGCHVQGTEGTGPRPNVVNIAVHPGNKMSYEVLHSFGNGTRFRRIGASAGQDEIVYVDSMAVSYDD